jgi:predicted ribosome quality control (RQC) complex YloA/Tae2 family protein
MNALANRGKAEKKEHVASYLSKSFLSVAIDEAIHRQNLALEALELAFEAKKGTESSIGVLPENPNCDDRTLVQQDHNTTLPLSKIDRMVPRRLELNQMIDRLKDLKTELEESKSTQLQLESIRTNMAGLGFGSILKQPMQSWKTKSKKEREFGIPLGFDGLVFYSPLGVPILVGRMNAHKDDIMRNAAQGSDLWFQVEDYNGSRVLLRSSLVRGTEGSKKCRQMAADIAARYSLWGEDYANGSIPVMYTDSRKFAKRGSKAGNMKQNKSLGRMFGRPQDVARGRYYKRVSILVRCNIE